MKELLIIMRDGCPYCEEAEKSIKEVLDAHPELEKMISLRRIDAQDAEASQYDFYYSPAYFSEGKKLSEGECGREAALFALEVAAGILNSAHGNTER